MRRVHGNTAFDLSSPLPQRGWITVNDGDPVCNVRNWFDLTASRALMDFVAESPGIENMSEWIGAG